MGHPGDQLGPCESISPPIGGPLDRSLSAAGSRAPPRRAGAGPRVTSGRGWLTSRGHRKCGGPFEDVGGVPTFGLIMVLDPVSRGQSRERYVNVLITCAGQRGDLIQVSRSALGGAGRVVACDMDPAAPARTVADRWRVVPRVDNDHLCGAAARSVPGGGRRSAVLPQRFEIGLLAPEADRFRAVGTRLVMADSRHDRCVPGQVGQLPAARRRWHRDAADIPECRGRFEAVADGQVDFPLVVKSRWGTSSLGGVEVVHDTHELDLAWELGNIRRVRRPGGSAGHPPSTSLASVTPAGPTRPCSSRSAPPVPSMGWTSSMTSMGDTAPPSSDASWCFSGSEAAQAVTMDSAGAAGARTTAR